MEYIILKFTFNKTGICEQILDDELLFETNPESLANKLEDVYNNYKNM